MAPISCSRCKERAVFAAPSLCKAHFCAYFEDKVKKTIKEFRMLKKTDRVAVAVSGGKDSLTVLHILKVLGYDVSAIAIDEGIKDYRENTLKTMRSFCRKNGIAYKIYTFKAAVGKTLDVLVKRDMHPCSVCGVLRRYLLNKHSRQYDAIVTGHNLDDESQAIIMNLVKNNMPALLRAGPVTGIIRSRRFTKRVKPLITCSEKEVMAYSFLSSITSDFNECPHAILSFRMKVRDGLNAIEQGSPGTKENILKWSLRLSRGKTHGRVSICICCGEPSSQEICKACQIMERIRCI